jgi:hypothetical protein
MISEQASDLGTQHPKKPRRSLKLPSRAPVQSLKKFKRSSLLIFIVVFVCIGLATLIGSFAFSGSSGDFEAETMTVTAP